MVTKKMVNEMIHKNIKAYWYWAKDNDVCSKQMQDVWIACKNCTEDQLEKMARVIKSYTKRPECLLAEITKIRDNSNEYVHKVV